MRRDLHTFRDALYVGDEDSKQGECLAHLFTRTLTEGSFHIQLFLEWLIGYVLWEPAMFSEL